MTRTPRAPRERRQRSLTESLLQIVIVLEAAALFFATLATFGMATFTPDWMAFIYGAAAIVVLVLASGVQHRSWGVWFGAVLQLGLIALGFIEPLLLVLGIGFAALWVFCFAKGRQVDRQKAAWLAQHAALETSSDTLTPADGTADGSTQGDPQ